jgi:hypothetical protein
LADDLSVIGANHLSQYDDAGLHRILFATCSNEALCRADQIT